MLTPRGPHLPGAELKRKWCDTSRTKHRKQFSDSTGSGPWNARCTWRRLWTDACVAASSPCTALEAVFCIRVIWVCGSDHVLYLLIQCYGIFPCILMLLWFVFCHEYAPHARIWPSARLPQACLPQMVWQKYAERISLPGLGRQT